MMKRWQHEMRLSMVFSLVVLIIFLITGIIMVGFAFAGMHMGLFDRLGLRKTFPVVLALLPASAIVGTVVALVFGRIPLRPFREMLGAFNKLAAGDFSARITVNHTPELRMLRDSFNRMAQELSSIEMLRSDFVNNFSHEFKTPIVSIKGFAELLKMEDLTAQERDVYLDIIIRESSRLATMATNVLNLSKIENQTIVTNRSRYDLTEQIRRCVLLLENAWENKRIDLEIDLEEITIFANEEMLSQIWLNLLDNAIKYSFEGGKISVTLHKIGNAAQATVRDYGRGIEEKDISRVFDKFYQSDTSHVMPGNGLGLTLARRIARLHGGDVTCASEPGHWTEFSVSLPLTDAVG